LIFLVSTWWFYKLLVRWRKRYLDISAHESAAEDCSRLLTTAGPWAHLQRDITSLTASRDVTGRLGDMGVELIESGSHSGLQTDIAQGSNYSIKLRGWVGFEFGWLEALEQKAPQVSQLIRIRNRLTAAAYSKNNTPWVKKKPTISSVHGFSKKFAIKRLSCFPPHLNYSLSAYCTFVQFNVLIWWKLQVSWCYCVKYIRFSPFLYIFYISQGTMAT